jgi:hypothetical protein
MTQIVTVSAATAAYATEGLKPSARVSGSTHTAEAVHMQVQEARRADSIQHAQLRDVVGPPAIAAFFVTAGERSRILAQTTMRQAEEAYLFGKEEVEETRSGADEHQEQPSQEGEDDNQQEFQEEQAEILALPSPEEFS